MAKLSEQYDNKSLIDLAKTSYEQKRISRVPTEIVDLPSAGKVYSESNPLRTGQVEMRYMTARDEDILTTPSFISEGIVFDRLLESIIVSLCTVTDLISADRDALIIAARILSYGKDYPVTVTDPETNKLLQRTVDLTRLKPIPFTLHSDANGEFDYKTDSLHIKFKYPPATESTTTITSILASYITEINGERDLNRIREFIDFEFLAKDSKKFREYIVANAPSINYQYEFTGESGSTFTAGFPIGPDLFWS